MKKLLALILAAALALSLVACGGDSGAGDNNTPSTGNVTPSGTSEPQEENNTMSKDELLETAETVNALDLYNAVNDNKAAAKLKYCDTPIQITGYVHDITDSSVLLTCSKDASSIVCIEVKLPIEELATISKWTNLSVIGIINDIVERQIEGASYISQFCIMDIGYLYND